MRVPNSMKQKVSTILNIESHRKMLIDEVYEWMEKQDIDTQDMEFADSIGVRLENSEFDNVNEFISELKKFKKGESVGYG